MRSRGSYRSSHSLETVDLRKLGEILASRHGEQAAIRARDLVELARRVVTQLGETPLAWEIVKAAADLELLVMSEESKA